MRTALFGFFVLFLVAFPSPSQQFIQLNKLKDDDSTGCIICTLLTSILGQMAEIHDKPVEQVVEEICKIFPPEFTLTCDYLVDTYGDAVIKLLVQDFTPDEVCHEISLCSDPTCHLWPKSVDANKIAQKQNVLRELKPLLKETQYKAMYVQQNKGSPWDWIVDLINRLAQKHEPIVDIDGDLFSETATLRGYNWRGKDCDDLDQYIYPGVKTSGSYPSVDYNCNGIYGTDPNTQQSYEDLLCKNSGQLGVAVLGDSAGAHFSIPPSYMNASMINSTTFNNLLSVLEDEMDWPMRSAYTAWEPSYNSIYKYMYERNRCNFKDYQNMGVNGLRSGALSNNDVFSFARNQTDDQPVLLFIELVGNDVCFPHPTFDVYTTPEQFEQNLLVTLNYLDTQLPTGSHIVFVGLADGRVLWDSLHNRTHPIGVLYEDVYAFLNCLEASPCWGWMNSNDTVRETTFVRASELSAVYSKIISNYTFKHFDMAYYDFPFKEIAKTWEAEGGQTWELIEPCDGFHPNQIANGLIADYFWQALQQDHPSFVGAENPNNLKIQQIFGNQGGYT